MLLLHYKVKGCTENEVHPFFVNPMEVRNAAFCSAKGR